MNRITITPDKKPAQQPGTLRNTTILVLGIGAIAFCLTLLAWNSHRAPLAATPRPAAAGALDEAAARETQPISRHGFDMGSGRHATGELPRAATPSATRGPAPIEEMVSVDHHVAEADVPPRAHIGDPLARLRDRLSDANPDRRIAAVHELAPVGEGATALQQILREDRDPRVRASAAVQLADGKGFAVIRSLLAALDDADPDVVRQSLGALASIGDASVVADLRTRRQAQTDAQTAARLDQTINELGAQMRRMPARPVFAEESRDLAPRELSGTAYADSPGSGVATATPRQP